MRFPVAGRLSTPEISPTGLFVAKDREHAVMATIRGPGHVTPLYASVGAPRPSSNRAQRFGSAHSCTFGGAPGAGGGLVPSGVELCASARHTRMT